MAAAERPALDIAAGVLQRADGQVLVAKRRPGTDGAGKWEFPGGKLEAGETQYEALRRELQEELGITVRAARPLLAFSHEYTHRRVNLQMWLVTDWSGEPQSCEGQPLNWTTLAALPDYDLLAANKPIVDALRLPDRYLITPSVGDDETAFLQRLTAVCATGISTIRLRQPQLDDGPYAELAVRVLRQPRLGAVSLLLDRMLDLPGAAGVHLSAARARQLSSNSRPEGWFGVSCHDRASLEAAWRQGADFATLSPVKATQSHPEATPIGWAGFEATRHGLALPVYALGGLDGSDVESAWQHGAQGVAAIRGFWDAV